MKFDPRKHHRNSIRLKEYDYAQPGAYFVTAVAFQREELFGQIVDKVMQPNRRGEIIREEWFRSADIRNEIRLFPEEFIVMPNHIHGIVWIVENGVVDANVGTDVNVGVTDHLVGADVNVGVTGHLVGASVNVGADVNFVGADGRPPLRRQPHSLGSFMAGFKSSVTKRMRDELNETGIWQRNYYERIIRNEKELNVIRNYIEANPRNWDEDEENPKT